jgi:Uncharacterised nucleotidyltransferase
MNPRRATRPDCVVLELARTLRSSAPPGDADPACGWEALLTLADEHRLLPALWSRLIAGGVRPLPAPLKRPDSALAILQRAYDENAARAEDLGRQGEALLCALGERDVDAIPLKGLHWLLAGWLPDPAARVMNDIDVLVPANRAATAVAVASDHRYEPVAIDDPEGMADHELITLMAPRRAGSVEIQVAPLVRRYDAVLPAADLRASAAMIDRFERAQKVPNPTHAIVLTIAHAQLQDECHRLLTIPLRALHDVALVVTNEQIVFDWDEVADRFARAGHARALAGFAAAADELFEVELPLSRRHGHRWVRRSRQAARHPRLARGYGEIVTIPRALSSTRMTRLYGARGRLNRSTARVRHVVRGVLRRLAGRSSR